MVGLLAPSSIGSVQLEGPEAVGDLLEVGPHGGDLVDHVLHADAAVTPQGGLDEVVGGDGGTLAVDLQEPTLVDQFAYGLEVGGSPSDVGL